MGFKMAAEASFGVSSAVLVEDVVIALGSESGVRRLSCLPG